jgi:hypothetical protein
VKEKLQKREEQEKPRVSLDWIDWFWFSRTFHRHFSNFE